MQKSPPTWIIYLTVVCTPSILLILSYEYPFLIDYYIYQSVGIFILLYLIYRLIKKIISFINRIIEERRKLPFTEKEVDRAFVMLYDLSKGVKPHFFCYPQYKSLYNSPHQDYFLLKYHTYFSDIKKVPVETLIEAGRHYELANFVYKRYPFLVPVPKPKNEPF
ncbi:hypothetical protein [Mongoliitalea lutea]|uniref:Uncharacterized protein n=1 Tax=Mongoliitalea lutea TaxID=849756 RepID=A0A8J3CZA9_9BACT|nr:hypothetical protein [Mongoliitalea lutea]GHB48353.1 hypothetical protein GCM10008106_31440 [Mongoliitalea lutea]